MVGFRGENVGSAYVRITADGSGMDDDIRDSLNDVGKAYDHAGNENAERYNKAFKKNMKSGPTKKSIQNAFDDQLAHIKYGEKFFKSKEWQDFTHDMIEKHGQVGSTAAARLERDFNAGLLDAKGVKERQKNITKLITDSTVEIQRGEQESNRAADAERKKHNDAIIRDFEAVNRHQQRLMTAHSRALSENARRDLDITRQSEADDLQIRLDHDKKLELHWAALRRAAPDITPNTKGMRDGARDTEKFALSVDHLAKNISKGFGGGARNNFVNLIGRMIGGIVKLGAAPIVAGVAMLNMAKDMRTVFTESGRGMRGAFAAAAIPMKGLGSLIASVGGGLLLLQFAVGPIVAALSLAAGVVTALAGSIGFALAGAAIGAGAVLLPLAGIAGTVALAFKGMTKSEKEAIKVKLTPLRKGLDSLRDAARGGKNGIFGNLAEQSKLAAKAMKLFEPVVNKIGVQISNLADEILKSANGPGFRIFADRMRKFLPDAAREMGGALVNVFAGIGGIILGAIPSMRRFTHYFDDLTLRFSKWANDLSPGGGQDQIERFFLRAGNSAKAFGGFLGSVGRLLGQLASQGRKTGDDMFGSMSKAIDGWTAKLKADPHILGSWFADAKKLGTVIGNVILDIGHLFDALDNPGSRTAILVILKTLGGALRQLGNVLNDIGPKWSGVIVGIGTALFGLSFLAKLVTPITGVATAIGLLGPAGAAAGEGAAGVAAFSGAALLLPVAVAVMGGIAAKIVGQLDAVKTSTFDAVDALDKFAASGKTAGTAFDQSSFIYGSSIGLIDKLTGGVFDLSDGMSSFGNTMERVAHADSLDKVFNKGSIDQIKQLDTQLTKLPAKQASAAFKAIAAAGKEQGLSMKEINALFPKYTGLSSNAGRVITSAFKGVQAAVMGALDGTTAFGDRVKALPKAVQIAVNTPGMIKSIADVQTLKKLYDLTPKQVVTTLVASGIGDTIGELIEVRRQMKLTPKQVDTIIKLSGKVKSLADVNAYSKALHLTPKERTTLLKVLGIKDALPTVSELNKQLKGVPKDVRTQIIAEGADATKKSLTDIILQSGNLNGKQIKAIFKAEGVDIGKVELQTLIDLATTLGNKKPKIHIEDDSKKTTDNWKRIGQDIDNLGKKKATPKILLDNKEFVKNKNGVITGIREIGKIKAKPKVAMDDTGFKIGAKGILTRTKGFGKLEGKPKVGLDDQGFIRNKKGVITGVAGMTKLTAKPKTDLELAKFNAGKGKVTAGVNTMGRLTARPHADLDHSKFDAGKARVSTGMSEADRLTANPKITVHADTSGAAAARSAMASVHDTTVYINVRRRLYGDGGGGPANPGASATGGVFGGMANYAQTRLIGEAGPEAVVPLMRPLAQVDPAVRWLSAIAQGKLPGMASGGVVGGGRTVNIGEVNVITPNTDTRAVAHEVVNRLVAVGY